MKRIGLIGGTSWESTVPYYKIINEYIMHKRGGSNTADMIIRSFNFHDIESKILTDNWLECFELLATAAKELEIANANFLAICSNTLHKCVPAIKKVTDLPIIHIVDETAKEMKKAGFDKALLLGTKSTMEEDFNINRFYENGIETIIPNSDDRQIIHDVIFNELCRGNIYDSSKTAYLNIINKNCEKEKIPVILGCTEIGMIIKDGDLEIPIFDTTKIHAEAIAKFALE